MSIRCCWMRQAGVEAHWVECRISLRARRMYAGAYSATNLDCSSRRFSRKILVDAGWGGALGFALSAGRLNGAAVIYPDKEGGNGDANRTSDAIRVFGP
jgi:hypothetical protein